MYLPPQKMSVLYDVIRTHNYTYRNTWSDTSVGAKNDALQTASLQATCQMMWLNVPQPYAVQQQTFMKEWAMFMVSFVLMLAVGLFNERYDLWKEDIRLRQNWAIKCECVLVSHRVPRFQSIKIRLRAWLRVINELSKIYCRWSKNIQRTSLPHHDGYPGL